MSLLFQYLLLFSRVIDRAYGSASLKGIKERQELKREVEEEGETMTGESI